MKRKKNDQNGDNPNLSCANSAETLDFLAPPYRAQSDTSGHTATLRQMLSFASHFASTRTVRQHITRLTRGLEVIRWKR